MLDSFMERADIIGNDRVEDLLPWLIQEQGFYKKKDEFWSVWELLKPRMIEMSNETERYYYSDYNSPIDKDKLIACYF